MCKWIVLAVIAAADAQGATVGKTQTDRILFLGNSITLHGPAKHIGWAGNCGMAASSAENDYVHLLLRQISKATGRKPEAMINNIADFERNYSTYDAASALKKPLEFDAGLVIVAIGENVPAFPSDEAKGQFRTAFAKLLAALDEHGKPAIVVRSCFWPNKAKDDILREVCREAGGTFVDMSGLSRDESHYARSERQIAHAGVAAHPGDKGMKAIADALWKAVEGRIAAPR